VRNKTFCRRKGNDFIRDCSLFLSETSNVSKNFEVLLAKQAFTNQDGTSGALCLVTNDLDLSYEAITAIYPKQWNVEVFHKSLKQNASLEKSPTKWKQDSELLEIAPVELIVDGSKKKRPD